MNYLNIYNKLMMMRKENPSDSEYTERHHILPKCMGGTDEADNLVTLSAKEHFVAHHLLYKHYKTAKMAHAWFMMLRCDPNQKRFFTARQHENAKIAHINALKVSMKGKENPFYGKSHTAETKAKISKGNKGRKKSQSEIDNWIEKVASIPKTDEHKAKIGRKNMVMLQNVDTKEIIRILKSEINSLEGTWVNPSKGKSEQKYKCDYCGVRTNKGNLKRWHNENCKHRV